MPLRYTATEKWEDRWYMSLSPNTKNILEFMESKCDCAGVWEPNFEDAEYRIGFQSRQIAIDWNDVFEELNREPQSKFKMPGEEEDSKTKRIPHVLALANRKWWLPRFIRFHYGKRGEDFHLYNIPLHIPIFRSLKENGCWQKFTQFYPDAVEAKLKSEPPMTMPAAVKLPTLEEVMGWVEGQGLPESELKLFHATYRSNGWKVNGHRVDDFPALLAKWKYRYERDKGEHAWKSESPGQLKLRIEALDQEIARQGTLTHKPAGKLHDEIKPEAMAEIRRLKGLKALYEEAMREKGGTKNAKSVSGDKPNPPPAS